VIGILNTHPFPSRELFALANFCREIPQKAIASSLSPMNSPTLKVSSTNRRVGEMSEIKLRAIAQIAKLTRELKKA
jgi:hypothetical protein